MTARTWKIAGIVLGALLVYVLVVERPFTDSVRGPAKKKTLLFPAVDPAAASRIEIKAAGRISSLEKEGGSWRVVSDGGFPADSKAVSDLLARVDTLAVGPVVSENPSKRSTFGVDESGAEVRIEGASGTMAHFWVGRSTPDYSGVFLRPEGSDQVYGIGGITRYVFDRGAQTWRDRKIVPFDAELVRKVTVAYNDTLLTLVREGADSLATAAWTVSGNRPDQPQAAVRAGQGRIVATTIAGLTADGFPAATDTIPSVWEPLALRLEVEVAGGDRVTIEFGPKNKANQHFVRRAGDRAVYLAGPWRLTRLKKTYAEVTQGPGAGGGPGGVAR